MALRISALAQRIITPSDFGASEAMSDPAKQPDQPNVNRDSSAGKSNADSGLQFRSSQRTASLTGFRIRGLGSCIPDRVVTNRELEEQYGFEEGWIQRRTGILQRRFAAPDQATSDLAATAAKRAMAAAGVTAEEIDLLVVGTFTPDYTCPSTACLVQHQLGIDAPAMDLQAACSGFMYALVTAAQFVVTGNARTALVIGADVNSRIVRPDDQRTAPLFGDGAGAVVLTAGEPDQGLLKYQLGADGGGGPLLDRPAGGTAQPLTAAAVEAGGHYLRMDGRSVFKWAIQAVTDSIQTVLQQADCQPEEVSLFVLHQANLRIIDHAMKVLRIPQDRVLNNLQRVGNTSAASIPLVLDEAAANGQIKRGDRILMCGFGAGLTWGTGLFRW